ncbi:C-terminal processing protease CtpA/Prc, contains a PDZ domain [Cnuella takakiae]|uniref:Tricorn protease homolog n=1 Tax=Cnuella takakiae TaxID=1302690 RepID=A0A1M5HIC9_9BACT|nr:S41 family peptidase [Cnuella takakiae]OLY92878.1 peptidase S41 [Cnuella takakiae]SHG15572.1 C-terminal processing protease CtpA/Prc, contains a PDZ domain [Cnuella takakiae]
MLKNIIASALLATGLSFAAQAQTEPSWMRYPSISPDGSTVVFTYKGDLYKVAATGGTAVPLTLHEAHDFMPVWSPDGKSIVFASDRYGNFDLYRIPATGGEAVRLTFHSANEYPYSFSPDSKQVYFGGARQDAAENRLYPAGYLTELYTVNANGGQVQQVLTTPAEDVKWSKDGRYMLYTDKKGGENSWRKHHVSAVARDIWQWDSQTGKHTQLSGFAGEDRNPVFADGEKTIYYLSEANGTFNVHKMPAGGGKGEAVTQFKKHPVRFLSAASNGTLSFSYDGHLYTQKPGAQPQKLAVQIPYDVKSNNERILAISRGIRDLSVSPSGKELAFIYRGEVFATSVNGGSAKRITSTSEQERGVSFAPDGKSLVYASERGRGWKIIRATLERKEDPYFFAAALVKEETLIDNGKEAYQPQFSPDGKEIAFVEDRMTLKVYNLASKQTRTLLTTNEWFSMRDNDQYFTWSPDGKYILFEYTEPGSAVSEVGVIASDGSGKKINLTESGFQDYAPKWVAGGKMMIWQSTRDGLRAQAASGGAQSDVYGMFFTQAAYDKFKLDKEEYALVKEQEEKAAKADSAKKEKKEVAVPIDWEGLKTRKARLTINSANTSDMEISKDGETLYYLAKFEKGFNLWSTNLRTRETKMLVPMDAQSAEMHWDKDQKQLFILADSKIMKLDPSGSSPKPETVALNGDLMLDVAAERAFMLEHVWRRTQKTFYTAGYHGINWEGLRKDYEAYLPHISNNHEFAEMLSELLGELNVSHSGASFVNTVANADATASLGAFFDYNYKGKGLKIAEVLAEGPLKKAGMNIQAGTTIEAIDGEAIPSDKDWAYLLNRKAGKNILLSLVDANGSKRELIVKPITPAEENLLLYKRWVRRNAEEVDRLSNGQLGYVHIPGMNDGAYRNFYEEVMGKYSGRKALVVDTRNNGGGDLVADLAMFLSGKKFLDYTTDSRSAGFEPNFRWTKPSIALANESNYSDGHCFAFSYQDLKLGKLVGMPVPGTCTFAGWETLQDESIRWGVPPLGVKDVQGRYLENLQTEPDIKVANDKEGVGKGKDQQLEVAIKALLQDLKVL